MNDDVVCGVPGVRQPQHHNLGPDTVASTGAIKEVLMVLNATGKVGPANRTRDGGTTPSTRRSTRSTTTTTLRGRITRRALARLTMTLNTAPEEEESSAEGRGGAGPPQPIGHHPGLLGFAQ